MDKNPDYDAAGLTILIIAAFIVILGFGLGKWQVCLLGSLIAFMTPALASAYAFIRSC